MNGRTYGLGELVKNQAAISYYITSPNTKKVLGKARYTVGDSSIQGLDFCCDASTFTLKVKQK